MNVISCKAEPTTTHMGKGLHRDLHELEHEHDGKLEHL